VCTSPFLRGFSHQMTRYLHRQLSKPFHIPCHRRLRALHHMTLASSLDPTTGMTGPTVYEAHPFDSSTTLASLSTGMGSSSTGRVSLFMGLGSLTWHLTFRFGAFFFLTGLALRNFVANNSCSSCMLCESARTAAEKFLLPAVGSGVSRGVC